MKTFETILKVFGVLLSFSFLTGCHSCQVNGTSNAKLENIAQLFVQTYISDLEVPWALEFSKDGRLYFTERPGRLRVAKNGELQEPIFVVDDAYVSGEAGLMGMALHPDFLLNHQIYLCYTTKVDNVELIVKRLRFNEHGVDEKIIIKGIPSNRVHAGCRLKFGPDRKLYITTGDGAEKDRAQKLDSLAGKTLRINDDGTVPSDNPFVETPKAFKEIWSLGHRNAQGMDFQPGTGLVFQTEHGPSGFDGPGGGDEVNIVEAGQNMGWPIVHHSLHRPGFVSPLLEYTPAIAPGGATFYRSDKYPAWQGNFFFGSLRGRTLIRVVLDGRRVMKQEHFFKDQFGRIRDVVEGPDGAIYFSTSNRDGRGQPVEGDDRIIRVYK